MRWIWLVAPIVTLSLMVPTAAQALSTTDFESRTRHQINLHRTPNVKPGPCVDRFAERWARHVADTGVLVHRDQLIILRRCNGVLVGEVIARGYSTPWATVHGWLGSPAHRAIITDTRYRQVGIGAVRDNQGRWVVVANFIRHG